jgi:hypothetical protein
MSVIFSSNYFNNKEIKKLIHDRIPTESPGMFTEKITIVYDKWYRFNEVIKLESQTETKDIMDFLIKIMNKQNNLSDFLEPYSTTFK